MNRNIIDDKLTFLSYNLYKGDVTMKVLICDDNPKIINQINNYLLKISKQSTYKFDSICFSNGDSILDKQTKIDFAFIDIEMPGVNGLTVTKHLQKINPNIIIFIVTSFQGYLDDAMDLNVFRFLSKPIDENRFYKSMNIALNLYHQSTEKIILDYFDECHNIFTIDILYLTIENRKTKIITKNDEYISNKKFDYWKNHLKSYDYFAQSHYSFIVNLKNVTDFDKNEITLSVDSKKVKVPVSRSFYASFKKAFYEYLGGTI